MVDAQLADVFVEMADTLVDDFDVIEFLHVLTERCVELLGVSAAGLLLTDQRDTLQVLAASSERTRLLEMFQLQTDQGPCVDCFRSGQPISVADLPNAGRWPRFAAAAAEVGFAAVHALPMCLRSEVIGTLSLFDVRPGALDEGKLRIGQALADVATIGLLQQRAIQRRDILTEQLQTALHSRVLIEQAKGVLAERLQVDVGEAFALLRHDARSRNRRLSELSQAIVDGSEQLSPGPPTNRPGRPPTRPRWDSDLSKVLPVGGADSAG
ncbi:GAF and ANTAR domain-containing protein [Polymorphospora sp. A560]|uniref:GAF and ANTAR domain-containing protein n=1 Tax=Polymorphospora sp. A560 TaxID=3040203 RepID=UPI003891F8F6